MSLRGAKRRSNRLFQAFPCPTLHQNYNDPVRIRSLFTALLLSAVLPAFAENAHVPARDYAAVAEKAIDGAQRSVELYLYLFAFQPAQPDSDVDRLALSLVRAQRRGVRVEVVLDEGDGPDDPSGKNRAAADFLSRS